MYGVILVPYCGFDRINHRANTPIRVPWVSTVRVNQGTVALHGPAIGNPLWLDWLILLLPDMNTFLIVLSRWRKSKSATSMLLMQSEKKWYIPMLKFSVYLLISIHFIIEWWWSSSRSNTYACMHECTVSTDPAFSRINHTSFPLLWVFDYRFHPHILSHHLRLLLHLAVSVLWL